MKPSLPMAAALATILLVSCATEKTRHPGIATNHVSRADGSVTGNRHPAVDSFALGSTTGDVSAVMGQPETIRDRDGGELWTYGFSTVRFAGGKVAEWQNHSGNLRTRGSGDSRVTKDEPRSREIDTGGGAIPSGAIVSGRGREGSPTPFGFTNPETQIVNGYTRSDGTQVEAHIRTRANSTTRDNFSAPGNTSPNGRSRGYR